MQRYEIQFRTNWRGKTRSLWTDDRFTAYTIFDELWASPIGGQPELRVIEHRGPKKIVRKENSVRTTSGHFVWY